MPAKSPESYLFDMLEAVRKIRRSPSRAGLVNAATGQITNPGSFGLIISASSKARLIQLGLKYRF